MFRKHQKYLTKNENSKQTRRGKRACKDKNLPVLINALKGGGNNVISKILEEKQRNQNERKDPAQKYRQICNHLSTFFPKEPEIYKQATNSSEKLVASTAVGA